MLWQHWRLSGQKPCVQLLYNTHFRLTCFILYRRLLSLLPIIRQLQCGVLLKLKLNEFAAEIMQLSACRIFLLDTLVYVHRTSGRGWRSLHDKVFFNAGFHVVVKYASVKCISCTCTCDIALCGNAPAGRHTRFRDLDAIL